MSRTWQMHPGLLDVLGYFWNEGCGWVINSDRFTDTLIEVAELLPPGLRPDAIMSAQRFIHVRTESGGYEPLQRVERFPYGAASRIVAGYFPCFEDWQQRY